MRAVDASAVTYLGDHLADGTDLVETLLKADRHLDSQLLVLLGPLPLLLVLLALGLDRLIWDVLKQRAVADDGALEVVNIAVIINLLAGADLQVARGELA